MPLVLLVEDDPDARYIYAASLKHARLNVVGVTTAAEATRAVQKHRPDLIVLDRRLPDGDGLHLARQWRSSGSFLSRVPIIVLTAYTTRSDVEAAIAAGCDAFLGKPCPGDILAAHVFKLLMTSTQKPKAPKLPH